MKMLGLFLLMVAAVSLQSTLIPVLAAEGVRPDLVLVVVVLSALAGGRETGLLCGVLGGLLQDLLSVGPLGFNVLTKMILGFGFGLYERKVNQGTLLVPVLAVAVATVFSSLFAILHLLLHGQIRYIPTFLLMVFPATAYHILLAVPFQLLLNRFMRRKTENNGV